MKTVGIIGAGEVGIEVARAIISIGYKVVIANSRGPETLENLIQSLGPSAGAATAAKAAEAGDFVVIAVPLKQVNNMPVNELAGKIVLDTNNYMVWRDGHFPMIDAGEKTVYELRQEHLPTSKVVQAFTHIQAHRIMNAGLPAETPRRLAFPISSNFPEAIKLVAKLFDQLGYDTVDNSPLSAAWKTAPGQPAWRNLNHQNRAELIDNISKAQRLVQQ
jgi:8-hydroxy-5-deazaflavin:NADPH oxidoreductase